MFVLHLYGHSDRPKVGTRSITVTATPTPDTPAAPLPALRINYTPAPKPVINLHEVQLVLTAFDRAQAINPQPVPQALATIVAAGSLQGLDLSQEATVLAPRLARRAAQPLMSIAH